MELDIILWNLSEHTTILDIPKGEEGLDVECVLDDVLVIHILQEGAFSPGFFTSQSSW